LPIIPCKYEHTSSGLEQVKWLQMFVDDVEVSPPGGELVRKGNHLDVTVKYIAESSLVVKAFQSNSTFHLVVDFTLNLEMCVFAWMGLSTWHGHI
jgi:hypothetical protein